MWPFKKRLTDLEVRLIISKAQADTHRWKLMLIEARTKGWEWPLIDEKIDTWLVKHPESWLA
jgi:hypothetical protein